MLRILAAGRYGERRRFVRMTTGAMLLFGFFSISVSICAAQAARAGLAASVDPMIGTGRDPSGNENLFPGAVVPFGMVQLSPDTESHGFGYHYYQPDIQGFSMTHMSGVGCPNEGDIFFTSTAGPLVTAVRNFESPYSHDHEQATPGYYDVLLSRWGINAELTATERTGIARFTFPAGKMANILVPVSHTLNYTVASEVHVEGRNKISGYVENRVFCRRLQTYKVYFVMTFSRPFSSFGIWHGDMNGGHAAISAGGHLATQTRHGEPIGAYARWPAATHRQTIIARIGISYVDLSGAENNLRQEAAGRSFSDVRREARTEWGKALSVIRVSGGTASNRRVFYTALYHSLVMPSIVSDADGRYRGFDDKIHHVAAGHEIYSNFSGWDIYRSEMPLLALIEPQRVEDMMRSIVLMYKQGGWIGRWPEINRYTNVMAGSPLTIVLSTAWLDGLHGFDIKAAWAGMLRDATEAPPPGKPYAGEAGIKWINSLHYVPKHKLRKGPVAQIEEDCIAYASLYRLAVALGKANDARMLYKRALYYRNVFDRQDGFFRPRNLDGQWTPGFDPAEKTHAFIEGSGWHYQWLVPEDLAWLIHAVGRARFNRRLLTFFSYKEPGWYVGQYYNPYDETDLQAPFEFNFSGEPWETQRVVRRILKENYTTSNHGVPGNDDCGEMSSWAVLSMMGIYTVDPASLAYELVSPVFSRIIIRLRAPYSGSKFTIEASENPQSKPYIQNVKLNGRNRKENWIPFGAIRAGGTLQFALGLEPSKSWGAAAKDVPPSLSNAQP